MFDVGRAVKLQNGDLPLDRLADRAFEIRESPGGSRIAG
jgi:hypothetical protein